jgi:ESX secretion-associated protein EspD/H
MSHNRSPHSRDAGDDGLPDAFAGYGAAWEPDDDEPKLLVFRVANPAASVSVTTHIDGRVAYVDLSTAVTRMTERHLADEIQVLANLARDQARAGQHALLNEFMTGMGHDPVLTRGFLGRNLDLPTPEHANEAKARVFATRYVDGDEGWS